MIGFPWIPSGCGQAKPCHRGKVKSSLSAFPEWASRCPHPRMAWIYRRRWVSSEGEHILQCEFAADRTEQAGRGEVVVQLVRVLVVPAGRVERVVDVDIDLGAFGHLIGHIEVPGNERPDPAVVARGLLAGVRVRIGRAVRSGRRLQAVQRRTVTGHVTIGERQAAAGVVQAVGTPVVAHARHRADAVGIDIRVPVATLPGQACAQLAAQVAVAAFRVRVGGVALFLGRDLVGVVHAQLEAAPLRG
ncbi:hypothetical protein G6F50_014225 [Rhizopus delemar]|uniref:Uncharacterized protein n=1 Tax=Rhizopus delemar TaxID=936053 RepID=A0A9P6Y8V1_9FUNG|nr:hypothetical protein G6F50_014225 [Rhizopus delemar]